MLMEPYTHKGKYHLWFGSFGPSGTPFVLLYTLELDHDSAISHIYNTTDGQMMMSALGEISSLSNGN